jgi:hypothetical protein
MLARVLANYHGFHCTVLFSLNDKGEPFQLVPPATDP